LPEAKVVPDHTRTRTHARTHARTQNTEVTLV